MFFLKILNRMYSTLRQKRCSNVLALCLLWGGLVALSGCGFQVAQSRVALQNIEQLKNYQFFLSDQVSRQELVSAPVIHQLYEEMLRVDLAVFSLVETTSPSVATPSSHSVRIEGENTRFGVVILQETLMENGLSVSQTLFNRHIEMTKVVEYQILDSQGQLIAQQVVESKRDLFDDQANPSAKTRERQVFLERINQDISQKIIQQIEETLGLVRANEKPLEAEG